MVFGSVMMSLMAFRATLVQIQKAKILRFRTETKKASETREEITLKGCLRFPSFFLFSRFPLSLGVMQQSALWGDAASSLELHLGVFLWMSMRFDNSVFSTFFIPRLNVCVCLCVCVLAAAVTVKPTDSPVMLEFSVHYYWTQHIWAQ